jgi:hypothetical protein
MELQQPIETVSITIISANANIKLVYDELLSHGIIPILHINRGLFFDKVRNDALNEINQDIKGIVFCTDSKKMIKYEC